MGSSATKAKRKWNKEHYTNITVAMSNEMAARLKESCKEKGISVSKVVTELVVDYLNSEVTNI